MIHPSFSHTSDSILMHMGTVCIKCGDEGFPETLVVCNECQACALHRYCLDGPVVFLEEVMWFCEDCEAGLVEPSSVDIRVPASPEHSDSISLANDAIKAKKELRNCINRLKKRNQQARNIIEKQKLKKRKISNQQAHKMVEKEKQDKRQISNQQQQKMIEEEKLKKRKVINQQKQNMIEDKHMKIKASPDSFAKTKALLSDSHKMPLPEHTQGSKCTREGSKFKNECELPRDAANSNVGSESAQVSLVATSDDLSFEELDHHVSAQPIAKPTWRGSLNFRNEAAGIVTELLAHMSSLACPKVMEETQLLPKVLCGDLLPRSVVWPKSFKYEGATDKSIALYFFPQSRRDEKAFHKLVDDIIQLELAIRVASINADLIIFPSTALPVEHRRVQAKYYLWGVFRGKQTSH
ncbi:hypothetical protein PIB30_065165 [Stylosanthes scabra]|uniref:AIPP2-like SPOC-like domain-containing protein n=1 Tax=Stylosanthes scabra TaxID=79078 RepID=A0ABU6SMY0_9FABA|nr:hypothetical protein [Stylosanthes scabra]